MKHVSPHLRVLDSWRGISIALVLAAHLFPLGVNDSVGDLGMVLFFNLSGFLITSLLLQDDATTVDFLMRRFFRIVPLAWTYMAIVFVFQTETAKSMLDHFFFVANLPPKDIRLATDHLWSLCVEVQFYVGIALMFACLKQRGLLLLPVLAVACTVGRIVFGVHDSSVTWFRIDEIFAGCTLALLHKGCLGTTGARIVQSLRGTSPILIGLLLALSCLRVSSGGTWFAYLRPYLGACLIGATLFNPQTRLVRWLDREWLYQLAAISYSLYVIHIGLAHTWLASGDLVEKYAKRPLFFAVLFLCAYASTRYLERPAIRLGKRLSRWFHAPAHSITRP